MHIRTRAIGISLLTILLACSPTCAGNEGGRPDSEAETTRSVPIVLWHEPVDIASRNLLYGPGGTGHQPSSTCVFLKEDLDGSNPKFVVRDESGVKWKVKLGVEARPETVVSRLIWAVGYYANEDYFLRDLLVRNLPAHLHRGQILVGADGSVHNVRLKRYLAAEHKVGEWRWRSNAFSGTRELNGLRVMMALVNNWDLKDINNSVYEEGTAGQSSGPTEVYMVSDLGAAFGTGKADWPPKRAKGNVDSYGRSHFIINVTPDYVDFANPGRPALIFLFNPGEYFARLRLRWIGKHISRSDVRWIGRRLVQLSSAQIRDAFRSAGYSPDEVERFSKRIEIRIAELNRL